jgi:hypothetical protein
MLEMSTTEEQHSLVLFFCGQKDSMKRKCLSRKAVHNWVRKSQMMPDQVRKWLRQQSEGFCSAGFDARVKRWDKFISVCGGYVENKCYIFPVRISHVLRFIHICDLFTDSLIVRFVFTTVGTSDRRVVFRILKGRI